MSPVITHEKDASRYVMHVNGELVGALDYALRPGAISLTRVFTSPSHRGKGYAGILVEHAVNDLEQNTDLRIVPMCSYVGTWFDDRPERQGLLSR